METDDLEAALKIKETRAEIIHIYNSRKEIAVTVHIHFSKRDFICSLCVFQIPPCLIFLTAKCMLR